MGKLHASLSELASQTGKDSIMHNSTAINRWRIAFSVSLFAVALGTPWEMTYGADKPADETGFVSLFDGKSLAGWAGATDSYRVEEGAIVCVPGSSGNLLTKKEFANFVLRFEFRLTAGANNGLGVRCPMQAQGNLHLTGTEIQILDEGADKFKDIADYQHHGSVYGIVAAKPGHLKPVGEWNTEEVVCNGRHIKVTLNGATIVDADLDEASAQGTLDGHEHPGLKRKTGHLGFLGHGDRIDARHIRIKELP
jgi:hypothetical protein